MTLEITPFAGGPIRTNTWLVADPESRQAIIVDAASSTDPAVARAVDRQQLTARAIIITHGHWDHIDGLAAMQARFPVPTRGHALVRERIEQPDQSATPVPVPPARLDDELDEGDVVLLGDHRFRVLFMLGHDPAHIVLHSPDDAVVMGGDVLFPDGHGRTDLPGADPQAMIASLRRFLTMDPETTVYPGHGAPTTVGREAAWIRHLGEDTSIS